MTDRQISRVNQQSKGETPLVSGMLQRAAVRSIADQQVETGNLRESRFQHDFTQVPIRASLPIIQAKLKIGAVGDKYEQEADRVATEVVEKIHAPAIAQPTPADEELQAKPSISELQRSPLSSEEKPEKEDLQAKSTLQSGEAIAGGETTTDLESTINSAKGSGQTLEAGLQWSIGQAMGADFSGVKIHTDAQSDQLNQSVQAKAFTTGQDIFFRQGAYDPSSRGGQELIAHELTHVVQQTGAKLNQAQDDKRNSHLFSASPKESLSIPFVQRDQDAAEKYTPAENHSMTNFFYQHHTTQGEAFNENTAISNHESRAIEGPNTLTNMTRADAAREIQIYLRDLSSSASENLLNQNIVYFNTHGYYSGIETEWNYGVPRVTQTFRIRKLHLGMIWNNGGYYQIRHFGGKI